MLIFSVSIMNAQDEDAWVYFNDKPSKNTFLNAPLTMLTQRALDRRSRYNIPLDFKDVPIEASYIDLVESASGISVLAKSKWLNALHVKGTYEAIDALNALQVNGTNIVASIEFADKNILSDRKNSNQNVKSKSQNKLKIATNFNYGQAANQIQMLKGEILHHNNFTGAGMQIAVIDAGFPNVDTFSAFQRLRDNNQILGGYDFVNRNANFYTGYYHGMAVLSTIACYIYSDDGIATNDFVGTAPDASFYLFITEDYYNETPLEESLWVEAAEEADRLGVDVINTSLGYYEFDDINYNYTYNNMDGQTTFITRGAEIAFSRGMLLVNSAGNEGNNSWHYIIAPADAPSVLSIGAVDKDKFIANFSSYGPTYDGRVKPDVCAEGAGVYIINASGSIATSNGTSFSGPIMAGMVTCLWQAFPNKTNAEITQIVKESAHLYSNPTNHEGYGIPNFETIYNTLSVEEAILDNEYFKFYPNPVNDYLNFYFPTDINEIEVTIYSLLGKKLIEKNVFKNLPKLEISQLPKGLYIIKTSFGTNNKISKFFKD
ncbi:Por secretion system C-terminal sorting domain-containing protein [Lutibacter maritimus]|uniref:Por secretion system C-terminal sorting domain-containing protein n=1 Tax=Lutibacter maritimus TaxID=593133 RepID=A0A1I6SK51_9FLAO|nr:Por secretion system C-terminal sorting domain-containing protein [Lutibacter maritimus]